MSPKQKNRVMPLAWAKASTLSAVMLSFGLSLGWLHKAQADLVVTPLGAATTEGNSNNVDPFNISSASESSARYQQVYNASLFSPQFPSGGTITELRFRLDGTFGGAFTNTLGSIRIDLSTTSASESTLSSTFASNVGGNDTIVYGGTSGGTLTLSSSWTGPVGGPKDLDIVITLATPFFYNPAQGNLLLDVRNFSGGYSGTFDAVSTVGDGVASVKTTTSGVNAATADISNTTGLVTAFTMVPEPGSLAFLGAAALTLLHRRNRRRA